MCSDSTAYIPHIVEGDQGNATGYIIILHRENHLIIVYSNQGITTECTNLGLVGAKPYCSAISVCVIHCAHLLFSSYTENMQECGTTCLVHNRASYSAT